MIFFHFPWCTLLSCMTYTDFLSSFIHNSSSTSYLSFSYKDYLTPNICLSLYQDQVAFLLSWTNSDKNSNKTLSFTDWVEPCGSPLLLHATTQVSSMVHTRSALHRFYKQLVATDYSFLKHQPKKRCTTSGLLLHEPPKKLCVT